MAIKLSFEISKISPSLSTAKIAGFKTFKFQGIKSPLVKKSSSVKNKPKILQLEQVMSAPVLSQSAGSDQPTPTKPSQMPHFQRLVRK